MTPKSGLERGGNLTLRLTSQGVLGKVDCQQTLFAKCRPSRIFRLGRHNLVGSRFKKMTSLTPWQMLYTLENSHVQPFWTQKIGGFVDLPTTFSLWGYILRFQMCVLFWRVVVYTTSTSFPSISEVWSVAQIGIGRVAGDLKKCTSCALHWCCCRMSREGS